MSKHNAEMIFASIVGLLYIVFGMLHILAGVGESIGIEESIAPVTELLFITGDVIGGACFVIIGAVFIKGALELMSGINAGVAFVYMGILLSLVYMVVYLLTMGGNYMDSFLVPDDYEDWTLMDNMRPGIYLGVLSLFGALYWRKRFSLNEILVFEEG